MSFVIVLTVSPSLPLPPLPSPPLPPPPQQPPTAAWLLDLSANPSLSFPSVGRADHHHHPPVHRNMEDDLCQPQCKRHTRRTGVGTAVVPRAPLQTGGVPRVLQYWHRQELTVDLWRTGCSRGVCAGHFGLQHRNVAVSEAALLLFAPPTAELPGQSCSVQKLELWHGCWPL